ncbi:MAG: GerAB/ArcD/ProY family transporter [Clostridia bacterium]|nr:GerAB/ArcD/ProY family transporter [Clostridia bacterium]
MEKAISSRQLAVMFFIATIALRLTVLPSIIYKDIGKEGFMLMAVHCVIELITFFIIYYLLKKNQNSSFYQFLSKILGRFGAKIIFFVIFALYFFKFLFLIHDGFVFARDVIFTDANLILYIFIMLSIAGSLYLFKLRAFARTLEIFYPIILISLIIILIIPVLTTEVHDIRPLLDIPAPTFLNATFKYLIFSGNFIFALLFMGKVKFDNNKKDFKTLFGTVLISILMLLIFYFLFNSIFKFTGFLHGNAISDLVQFVPSPSILGNFDIITITIIKLVFILYGGLYTFVMCDSIEEIIRRKKTNKVDSRKWILFSIFALVLFFVYFVFSTPESLNLFLKDYMSYFITGVLLIVLILYLIEICRRKGKKYEKNI